MVKWVHDDNLRQGEYFFLHDDVPDAMSKEMRIQMLSSRWSWQRAKANFNWPSFVMGFSLASALTMALGRWLR